MKKILCMLLFAVISMSASAQFEKGTQYANASLTGFNMGWGGNGNGFCMGLGTEYGYYVADCWMLGGEFGYQHRAKKNNVNLDFKFRYSFKENGLNLGCGLGYAYDGCGNYAMLTPQVGYTFYLNHYISLEPAFYYRIAMNDFSNGSSAGLKIGVGIYF